MNPSEGALRAQPSAWHLEVFGPLIRNAGARVASKMALRTRSFAYRHYFAWIATNGELDYAAVCRGDQPQTWNAPWLVALAETMVFQDLGPEDRELAIPLLQLGVALLPDADRPLHEKHLAQLLITKERWEEAEDLLHRAPHLLEIEAGYLHTDLLNPFAGSPLGDHDRWYAQFSAVFTELGLSAPRLEGDAEHPFDRLRADTQLEPVDGPLVSVVMTTYCAEPVELRTSVQSILDQTWQNLEIIMVDDCSPEEFVPGLEEIAALDPRIRLVRQPENGGTYLARNTGIRMARGEIVTGQDADDWSHPERLALQAAPMLEDREVAGSRCITITTNEWLVTTRPGYNARRPNPSSLMFWKEDALATGGFLPARKGADSEFFVRLNLRHPKPVITLTEAPLSIVRIRSDSLSRGDFRAGWSHANRRAFIDGYRHWHAVTPIEELRSVEDAAIPLAIPTTFQTRRGAPRHFDVVWVADYRLRTFHAEAREAEIRALVDAGLKVAVLHLEDPRYDIPRKESFDPAITTLVNEGIVARVAEDDPHSASLAVIRQSALLATPPATPIGLSVSKVALVADHLLPDAEQGREALAAEAALVRELFGVEPTWVAPTDLARDAIAQTLKDARLAESTLPDVVDPARWGNSRTGLRSDIPVIGRVARDSAGSWPSDGAELASAYPVDDSADVRTLGGARFARRILGRAARDWTWVNFRHDEIRVRTFLSSLDFFVYVPAEQDDPVADPTVVEALASGCVVILPPSYAYLYGDAALYTGERSAVEIAAELHASPEAFLAQSAKGRAFARRERPAERVVTLCRELLGVG